MTGTEDLRLIDTLSPTPCKPVTPQPMALAGRDSPVMSPACVLQVVVVRPPGGLRRGLLHSRYVGPHFV